MLIQNKAKKMVRMVMKNRNKMKVSIKAKGPNRKDGTLEVVGMVEIKGKISDRDIMINRNSTVTHADMVIVKTMAIKIKGMINTIIDIIMMKDKVEDEDMVIIEERKATSLGMI